jgi:H+/Cl- antiporter ClcA
MAQTFTGLLCLFFGLALTFFFPIQRGRLQNQLWDLIVLGLFVAAAYFLNIWVLRIGNSNPQPPANDKRWARTRQAPLCANLHRTIA